MAKIVAPTADFQVIPGIVFRIGSDKGAAEIALNLSNGNLTTVTLPGISPAMVKEFLGSDTKGTPALLLSRKDNAHSVGVGKEGTGVWLMSFGSGS